MKKTKSLIKKIVLSVTLLIILAALGVFYIFLYPNISTKENDNAYLYIYKESTFDDIVNQLKEKNALKNVKTFKLAAHLLDFPNQIKTGRYKLTNDLSNLKLLHNIRNKRQEALNITFNNVRTKEQLAKRLDEQLEMNAEDLLILLNDNYTLGEYDFDSLSVSAMFIPNTYEVYWDISTVDFFIKMHSEYEKFWTEERKAKAEKIGFSPIEISTLASIVESESNNKNEQPTIAGLYINRLKINKPLESDPTVIFAIGDFSIRRVWGNHLKTDSPYNTYKNKGLPPGPIRIPSIQSIDAVLNYEHHNYIYMCAKDDFSGQHAFSTTYKGHLINAAKYRKALNERKIYK